jgi:hypothetical protein
MARYCTTCKQRFSRDLRGASLQDPRHRPVCAGCNPHNRWNPRKRCRNGLPKHASEDAEDIEDAGTEDAETDADADADAQRHNKHSCADHAMQT